MRILCFIARRVVPGLAILGLALPANAELVQFELFGTVAPTAGTFTSPAWNDLLGSQIVLRGTVDTATPPVFAGSYSPWITSLSVSIGGTQGAAFALKSRDVREEALSVVDTDAAMFPVSLWPFLPDRINGYVDLNDRLEQVINHPQPCSNEPRAPNPCQTTVQVTNAAIFAFRSAQLTHAGFGLSVPITTLSNPNLLGDAALLYSLTDLPGTTGSLALLFRDWTTGTPQDFSVAANFTSASFSPAAAPVPLPASAVLLLSGLITLALRRKAKAGWVEI